MAAGFLRQCRHPGCQAIVPSPGPGLCERHQTDVYGYDDRRGSAASRGYGRPWQTVRAVKLTHDPLCEIHLLTGQVVCAQDVHHIDGNAHNNHRENLQSLCHECHSRQTVTQQGGFGNQPKGSRP